MEPLLNEKVVLVVEANNGSCILRFLGHFHKVKYFLYVLDKHLTQSFIDIYPSWIKWSSVMLFLPVPALTAPIAFLLLNLFWFVLLFSILIFLLSVTIFIFPLAWMVFLLSLFSLPVCLVRTTRVRRVFRVTLWLTFWSFFFIFLALAFLFGKSHFLSFFFSLSLPLFLSFLLSISFSIFFFERPITLSFFGILFSFVIWFFRDRVFGLILLVNKFFEGFLVFLLQILAYLFDDKEKGTTILFFLFFIFFVHKFYELDQGILNLHRNVCNHHHNKILH